MKKSLLTKTERDVLTLLGLLIVLFVIVYPVFETWRPPIRNAVSECSQFKLDVYDPNISPRHLLIVLSPTSHPAGYSWLKSSYGLHELPAGKVHFSSGITLQGHIYPPQLYYFYSIQTGEFGWGHQWLYAPPAFRKWVVQQLIASRPVDE